MAEFLKERNCLFIEQPFPKLAYEWSYNKKNILPVFADESNTNFSELEKYFYCFDRANI
jgi:L-alanine-DL-glutamate epimerase-like enolase superfamily enzyme